jgi:hypothetical protein
VTWGRIVGAVAQRPALWPTAARQARRLVPPGWWRHRPFLPVPDRQWLRFRAETQYGDPDRVPDADDVVTWLRWAQNRRTPAGRGR